MPHVRQAATHSRCWMCWMDGMIINVVSGAEGGRAPIDMQSVIDAVKLPAVETQFVIGSIVSHMTFGRNLARIAEILDNACTTRQENLMRVWR